MTRFAIPNGVTRFAVAGAIFTFAGIANAQLEVSAAERAGFRPNGPLGALVQLPPGASTPPGMVQAAPGFAILSANLGTLAELAHAHPDWSVTWSPPRRPLLDQAAVTTHAALFRNLTGATGKDTIIGIVDTGFDPLHADLRDANGKTRVAWVLDFSRQPFGRHPELESEYGCTGNQDYTCAVLSGTDLDELAAANSPLLPRDTLGHGTHVASLAGGNGLSQNPPRYVGPAPEATYVIARVTRGASESILDPDVLLATRFVFDRADEAKLPAVVNLSLGSDFGGHDGRTALELGLASFVGPAHPGRAIVVAAGNSASLYATANSAYPGPFGIYTEVHVPRESDVRVPILTPPTGASSTQATLYVWIAERPGDQLEVGVDDADGEWVPPLGPGDGATYEKGGVEATIVNRDYDADSPLTPGSNGAIVVIDGTWKSGTTFGIRLQGHGSARLWVQSEGDLAGGSTTGALFPRATREGTIGIPASSSDLISVGAIVNRIGWIDREGRKIKSGALGGEEPEVDSSAFFSGAGPNSLGHMKPDIVAPGVFVAGAMSSLADPKNGGAGSMFASSGSCGQLVGCLIVDDFHGISSGTSMSAPIVSGGIALLFERDPNLTQPEVLRLLQAGARAPDGNVIEQEVGPGALDLKGSLAIQDGAPIDQVPDPAESWMALASSYAHPDPEWPLEGVVQLRAADEGIADGFDHSSLRLEVSNGTVQSFTRAAPGFWKLAVIAPAGSGGATLGLRVMLGEKELMTRRVPIGVDRWVANDGVDAQGGCSQSPSRPSSIAGLGFCVALILLGSRRCREL